MTKIKNFPYSKRSGTIGESLPDQVSDEEKNRRADIIKAISKTKFEEFINKNIGKTLEILIEKHRDKHKGNLKRMTRKKLKVQNKTEREDLFNTIQTVKITEFKNNIIYGELLN